MQARGSKAQVLIDFETVFNTLNTTPAAIKLPVHSSKLQSKQNMVESTLITGSRNATAPGFGNINVSGSIEVPVDQIYMGYILKALLGAPVTTGSAAPYTHVFKMSDTQPSLTIENGFTDIGVYNVYTGCKINKFAISFGGDGELKCSLNFLGCKEIIGNASIDATPTSYSLKRFGNFQATLKEGGANVAVATSVDTSIDTGLDGDTYVLGGGGFRQSINEGVANISGTIKAFFENLTLLNKAINGTESSVEIKLAKLTNSLTFLYPEVIYERNSPGIDGPKGVSIDLPYRAYYDDSAEGSSLIVTLVNDHPSYV